MENLTTLRIDLGINAQKIIQQVQIHNHSVEDEIARGVQLALDDILKEDGLIELIRVAARKELLDIMHKTVISWDTRDKITKLINEKVGEKIHEYADRIAEQLTSNLNPPKV